MNILAALAEMAMWGSDVEDRNVVDTLIEEFPERLGELAERMCEIYGEPIKMLILTL